MTVHPDNEVGKCSKYIYVYAIQKSIFQNLKLCVIQNSRNHIYLHAQYYNLP